MRFWIRRRSSGSVTSLQLSPLVWCLEEELEELWCFLELEEEEECGFEEEEPEGMLAVSSFSVSEPGSLDSASLLGDTSSWWMFDGACACRGAVCCSNACPASSGSAVVVMARLAIDSVMPGTSDEDIRGLEQYVHLAIISPNCLITVTLSLVIVRPGYVQRGSCDTGLCGT